MDKFYKDLTEEEQDSLCVKRLEHSKYLTQVANTQARTLTNWLYALNSSAIGFIFLKKISSLSAWFFFISLAICIITNVIEYWKFSWVDKNLQTHFNTFIEINSEMKLHDYNLQFQKVTGWPWLIIILRFIGYILLFSGAILLYIS